MYFKLNIAIIIGIATTCIAEPWSCVTASIIRMFIVCIYVFKNMIDVLLSSE